MPCVGCEKACKCTADKCSKECKCDTPGKCGCNSPKAEATSSSCCCKNVKGAGEGNEPKDCCKTTKN
ncbi:metallothionein-2 [Drosophila hydei]|uniref:Metallothionein-2 n=1 Tax=Drosophila hydei TaxID=7224 RepID=A0A6J1L8X6_DROHY|nr:metallothionein-2 [Drosophila hydei]